MLNILADAGLQDTRTFLRENKTWKFSTRARPAEMGRVDARSGTSRSPVKPSVFAPGKDIDLERDRCTGGREQPEALHASMVQRVRAVMALTP